MNKEDKKLQKHLVDEMMKVSKTNPDVMFYMEALMKKYEELEKENINIKQQLLENKISLKDIEYQEKIKYKSTIDKIKEKGIMYYDPEYSKIYGELCSMPGANNTRTPVIVIDDEILELLEEIE